MVDVPENAAVGNARDEGDLGVGDLLFERRARLAGRDGLVEDAETREDDRGRRGVPLDAIREEAVQAILATKEEFTLPTALPSRDPLGLSRQMCTTSLRTSWLLTPLGLEVKRLRAVGWVTCLASALRARRAERW